MPRATKDVDLLGSGTLDPVRIRAAFREILSTEVEPDGLSFDVDGVKAEAIREEAVYDGVRVTFGATRGTARLALQVCRAHSLRRTALIRRRASGALRA